MQGMKDRTLHLLARTALIGMIVSALSIMLTSAALCAGPCISGTGTARAARMLTLSIVSLTALTYARSSPKQQLNQFLQLYAPDPGGHAAQLFTRLITAGGVLFGFGLTRAAAPFLPIPLLTEAHVTTAHLTTVLPYLFGLYGILVLLSFTVEPKDA